MSGKSGVSSHEFHRWLCKQQGVLPRSALRYTLEALIPYTDANLKLAFKPHLFFNELEKIDAERQYSHATLRRAYYEAKKHGYIIDGDQGHPVLSAEAEKKLQPFQPEKLHDSLMMVIFDIPEVERWKRRWFRLLLREMRFEQIQKSVWVSHYECKAVLSAGIIEHRLEDFVRVFEARAVE
jgi:DNA-binding transcriptional regulator PaaX